MRLGFTWWRVLPPPEQPRTSTLLLSPEAQESALEEWWRVKSISPAQAERGSWPPATPSLRMPPLARGLSEMFVLYMRLPSRAR